ncbi:MAG: cysteine--tRNA ligase, partial [Nanoarchaeota archaeon]
KNKLSANDANKVKEFMISIDQVLGVLETEEEELPEELQKLIDERENARQIKNWARSDEIRDELKQKGIILEDTLHGIRWKRE